MCQNYKLGLKLESLNICGILRSSFVFLIFIFFFPLFSIYYIVFIYLIMARSKIIIVGSGTVGISSAYAISQNKEYEIVVFDQYSIPSPHASSTGNLFKK